MGCPLKPSSSMTRRTASIWSSVASCFITISMLSLYLYDLGKVQQRGLGWLCIKSLESPGTVVRGYIQVQPTSVDEKFQNSTNGSWWIVQVQPRLYEHANSLGYFQNRE